MAPDSSQWSRILTADSSRAGAGPRVHIGQRGAYVQKRHSDVHAAASVSAWLPCASGADAAGAVPNRVARPWLGANPVFRCLVRHRGGLAVQPVPRSAGGHPQPSIPRGKTQASAQEGQVLDLAVPTLAAHLADESLETKNPNRSKWRTISPLATSSERTADGAAGPDARSSDTGLQRRRPAPARRRPPRSSLPS